MDAIALLKHDHDGMKQLLKELTGTSDENPEKRRTLIARISKELMAHEAIEEEIFYPAFKEAVSKEKDKDMYHEAVAEHRVADYELGKLENEDPASEAFAGMATVLQELIEHHIKDEETEMFPSAKKALGDQLEPLGVAMEERKRQLLEGA